jgi:methyltransferase (TIGR00027 family)
MKADRPSQTALRVALARAAHQVVDAPPRVLEDPFALKIVGAEAAARLVERAGSQRSPFRIRMRAFVVARSRIAEDELAAAMQRGVRQYVVLGAGLDTFALRNRSPAMDLRVFEVDHPATQAWKRRLLAQAGIAEPGNLAFVPVDFERTPWLDALRQAGFRSDEPAHFAWLGVAMYLDAQVVAQTLASIATLPAGSSVVFDYLVPASELGAARRAILAVLSGLVALAGEPLRSHFTGAQMQALLRESGFGTIGDLGPDELNARFYAGRADGLRVGEMGRIACARV